jgi:hypothetical protein
MKTLKLEHLFQIPESKIKNRNDFEIMDFSITKTDGETKEVEVKWKPKK